LWLYLSLQNLFYDLFHILPFHLCEKAKPSLVYAKDGYGPLGHQPGTGQKGAITTYHHKKVYTFQAWLFGVSFVYKQLRINLMEQQKVLDPLSRL